LFNGGTELDVPFWSFEGDFEYLANGAHTLVWDPTKTVWDGLGVLHNFRAEVVPVDSPLLYMVVDLTKMPGAPGQITYLSQADICSGAYGSVETNVWGAAASQSVAWTGVTNDPVWATDRLVLRRIPRGTFMIGEGAGKTNVTLTAPFYIGVFEFTQAQMERVYGTTTATSTLGPRYPTETLRYNRVRGWNGGSVPINWPVTGYNVDAGPATDRNVMYLLRQTTGNVMVFDLPTSAQWEYACRAGTTTAFNNGSDEASSSMPLLGRFNGNGSATAQVGSYRPNAWGLYDMHGNVFELCREWYSTALFGGADPVGATNGTSRTEAGGGFTRSALQCRSVSREGLPPDQQYGSVGFRVVALPSVPVP
jgi:formylglycine-generating enzyme required for sulfatase activity